MGDAIRILFVEDLPPDVELVEREVRKVLPGSEFRCVETLDDYLEALASYRPDMILFDFKLPGIDGLSALKLAQEHSPEIPFFVVTGSINEDTAVECVKSGACDYILKEHIKRLGPAIMAVLAQKRLDLKRKQAEKTLTDELILRQILIEESRDGIVVLDQDGKVLMANRRYAEMLGYSPEEILQLHIWDWDVQWQREELLQIIRISDADGYLLETRHRRKDGAVFDVEISTNRAVHNGQKLVLCICRDISDRKQREDALQESEKKYRMIAENTNDLIRVLDLDTMRFTYASPSVKKITGYTVEEYLDRPLENFLTPQSLKLIMEVLSEGFKRNANRKGNEDITDRTEWQEYHKDGHLIWVEAETAFIKDDHGKPIRVIGVSRDISERKKAEEELKNRNKSIETILANLPIGLAVHKNSDNTNIYMNERFEDIYGWKREDIKDVGEFFLHVYPDPDYREKIKNEVLSGIASGDPSKMIWDNIEITTKAGGKKTVAATNIPLFQQDLMISTVQDITERKRMEMELQLYHDHLEECIREATADLLTTNERLLHEIAERKHAGEKLRESEEKYRILFEKSIHGILVVDLGIGRMIYANPSICRMLGYSETELLQLSVKDLHPKESLEYVMSAFDLQRRGEKALAEFPCLRKDGTVFYADVTASPIIISGRECVMGFFEDITERQRTDEKIKALNEELKGRLNELIEAKTLEEEARMAKAEFLANISHELTTPLNSIIGFSQVLLEKNVGELNEKQQGYVEHVLNSGERLHNTLAGIVSFVRMDVSNPDMDWEEFRLKDVVNSSLSVFRKVAIDRNLTLTLDMEKEADRLIRADRGKLIEVFHNLLSNAVKFSQERGKITLRIRYRKGSEASGKDDFMEVTIEDTGIGIKEGDLTRLFQPFQQLEAPLTKEFAGVGMGLILTKKFIEAHGGAIRAESDYGRGSRFIFTIPFSGGGVEKRK